MKEKKLERIVTRAGIIMLMVVAFIGILACFDLVFDWDIFPSDAGKDVLLVLSLVLCVLILCCVMVSAMLNISRMANSLERMAGVPSES